MLKRLSLYTFLLCLVPIFVWIFSWKWAGDAHLTQFDQFLYWLTETGSSPYALITCGVFALLFAPIFPNRKKWTLAVIVMALATCVTQGIKSVSKTVLPNLALLLSNLQKNPAFLPNISMITRVNSGNYW